MSWLVGCPSTRKFFFHLFRRAPSHIIFIDTVTIEKILSEWFVACWLMFYLYGTTVCSLTAYCSSFFNFLLFHRSLSAAAAFAASAVSLKSSISLPSLHLLSIALISLPSFPSMLLSIFVLLCLYLCLHISYVHPSYLLSPPPPPHIPSVPLHLPLI